MSGYSFIEMRIYQKLIDICHHFFTKTFLLQVQEQL